MGSAESIPSKPDYSRNSGPRPEFRENARQLQEKFENLTVYSIPSVPSVVVDETRRSTISASKANEWVQKVLESPKNRLALNALSANDPSTILRNNSVVIKDEQVFNLRIPQEGAPVTNQRASGRCWLFASTNVFRVAIMKKYALDKFECSQAYLFFWDKVEKANYFLENILETADEPTDSRIVATLMSNPVSDGGQWDMVVNLVEKYGLVPQVLYPDSWNAMSSSFLDRLITSKLREDALILRNMKKAQSATSTTSLAAAKDSMMKDIVKILTLSLGPPPSADEKFTWEYHDKNKKYEKVELTPIEFARGLCDKHGLRACGGTDVTRLFSLVNDPRNEYESLLTVDRLGNVWGGRPITYVNVNRTTMKKACIAMLKNGWPVFFGCDVGKSSDRVKGVMDLDLFNYELGFDIKLRLNKKQRLETGESAMTHAMVLTGVHLSENGEPQKWRVENSWSDTVGTDGYFVMSDRWMDEYCYQAVVDPSVVSATIKDVLNQKPKKLNLWDPMGALA